VKVFVVGRVHDWSEATGFPAWELLGVYRDHDLAVLACHDVDDFVWPIDLDKPLPAEPQLATRSLRYLVPFNAAPERPS
jgi:hypothetical protein